jgi:aryl-alcohol dehydrogenase-like predicted oxidoreductase
MDTMDEAIALGLDVFDTAEKYAGGRSESMVGTWIASNGMTDRVQIVTKVTPPPEPRNSFDAAYIRQHLARSLERLGIDLVALYLIHAPHENTPIEVTFEGLVEAKMTGHCSEIGLSNVDTDQLARSIAATGDNGAGHIHSVQNMFNLLTPDDDAGVRDPCRRSAECDPFTCRA